MSILITEVNERTRPASSLRPGQRVLHMGVWREIATAEPDSNGHIVVDFTPDAGGHYEGCTWAPGEDVWVADPVVSPDVADLTEALLGESAGPGVDGEPDGGELQ
jgi:hypothetical protein